MENIYERIPDFNYRNKIDIIDADDFQCVITDIFEAFLESFTYENKLIRPVTENDDLDFDGGENITYMYSHRGHVLAERMLNRLYTIGNKYFPDEDFEIRSHLYQEP